MACFNFSLCRSKRPGKLSAYTGSACMIWLQHSTRNKATSRRFGLSPVRLAPPPHNPDIPIAVRRECPLAYRGNRPGIHPHHGRLVLPTAGEKGDNQAFRNTSHTCDSQALTLHPLSACSTGVLIPSTVSVGTHKRTAAGPPPCSSDAARRGKYSPHRLAVPSANDQPVSILRWPKDRQYLDRWCCSSPPPSSSDGAPSFLQLFAFSPSLAAP